MKRNFPTLFLLLSFFLAESQTWNLPARDPNAMNGSQFISAITSLSFSARETMVEQEILAGNVPSFYRNLQPVTSTATISGNTQSVTYFVTPDYLAVGTDTNYFLCPMSPMVATHIGDATGCTLPTRKMVNDIYAAASVKLTPQPIPASSQMTTVPVFADHNDSVYIQRHNLTWSSHPLGELTGGDKKDVVISNLIYNTANRVVIYGWHQSIGNPIQPLSNVHADTYMDYSHGIRMVQDSVIYNGNPTTVQAILMSSTLNPLLSDEGIINPPNYPYSTTITALSTPTSFAIKNNGDNTLSIIVSNDANATHYKIYTSTDGINFSVPQTLVKTSLTLNSVTPGQIYFIKIAAYNQPNNITSANSELLAAIPSSWQDSILIVNGFDRAVAGNTYNFIIQHGNSIYSKGMGFSSCTNEAVTNNLLSLNTYKAVDWILGLESSVNETFSATEQTKVSVYLQQGGFLFVSGSEIGWDLDHLGSTSDKAFYNNYLKSTYLADAPDNQSATWYNAIANTNGIFNLPDTCWFDDGSHGTYNVSYPDVLDTINGSYDILEYTNNSSGMAGVAFRGIFPSGTDTGKLVYLAFPFETIYPTVMRDSVMFQTLDFFFKNSTVPLEINAFENLQKFVLYPNPASDKIRIISSTKDNYEVTITDISGKTLFHSNSTPGIIDISFLEQGFYFLEIKHDNTLNSLKFIKE